MKYGLCSQMDNEPINIKYLVAAEIEYKLAENPNLNGGDKWAYFLAASWDRMTSLLALSRNQDMCGGAWSAD